MKVGKGNEVVFRDNQIHHEKQHIVQKSEEKQVQACCLDCQCSYGKSIVNISFGKNAFLEKAEEYVPKIIEPNEHVDRFWMKNQSLDPQKNEYVLRVSAGKLIPGFNNLYDYDTRIACYFDKDGNIDKAFKLKQKANEAYVYDKNGDLTHHYSKEDMEALHFYKYHPDSIHQKLRYSRNMWSGNFMEEALEMMKRIENMFQDESKVFRTDEDKTLYRALQKFLSQEQKDALSTIGEIYIDDSFCSTSESLDVAKRFSCGNPILKINVPKGSKFIDVERLFNIDRPHWREEELLFDKNSKFLVTGYDSKNNIIEVDYLG